MVFLKKEKKKLSGLKGEKCYHFNSHTHISPKVSDKLLWQGPEEGDQLRGHMSLMRAQALSKFYSEQPTLISCSVVQQPQKTAIFECLCRSSFISILREKTAIL